MFATDRIEEGGEEFWNYALVRLDLLFQRRYGFKQEHGQFVYSKKQKAELWYRYWSLRRSGGGNLLQGGRENVEVLLLVLPFSQLSKKQSHQLSVSGWVEIFERNQRVTFSRGANGLTIELQYDCWAPLKIHLNLE